MKYFKRLNLYKASAVTFNPTTFDAYSYSWWKFVAKVEGKVIFNNYTYSPSTTKHQYKVRALLNELNIKIDITAPFPRSIPSTSLTELVQLAEEGLCDKFLSDECKRIDRNAKAQQRRMKQRQDKIDLLTKSLGLTANCDDIYKKLDKLTLVPNETETTIENKETK